MKNRTLILVAFVLMIISGNSQASEYACSAKANPTRGFNFAFQILIDSTNVGGKIFMKSEGRKMNLGVIAETGRIRKSNPAQRAAFDATLGLISEKDVSGLSESDLDKVDMIQVYRSEVSDGDEVLVYRLFSKRKQIGGSVLISGMGTSCLP